MKVIAETNRLLLREFELSDAIPFYNLNANWEVIKYTGDKAFDSIKAAEELIVNYSDYKKNGYGRNTMVIKSSGEVIGWCGLKKHGDGLVDLGYRIFEKDWNQGHVTEASHAMLEVGFMQYGINEIVGRTHEKNLASIRVLEKIGMKFWKRESCEGIENSLHYRIDRQRWEKIRNQNSK